MASRISVPGLIAVVAVVVLAARASGQNTATFDIPFDKLPGGRMNAQGNLDPTSSPADAHAGAFVAAKKLGLFRNFEWLHWVPTAPSKRDPATGRWSGGDLDGFPTGWGSTRLGIAGDCLYWGRSNSTNTTGPRVTHDIRIYKILHPDLRHERARRTWRHAAQRRRGHGIVEARKPKDPAVIPEMVPTGKPGRRPTPDGFPSGPGTARMNP